MLNGLCWKLCLQQRVKVPLFLSFYQPFCTINLFKRSGLNFTSYHFLSYYSNKNITPNPHFADANRCINEHVSPRQPIAEDKFTFRQYCCCYSLSPTASTRYYHTTAVTNKIDSIRDTSLEKVNHEIMSMPTSLSDQEAMVEFLKHIDAVMFDCDGVLWLGTDILPNAPELIKKLRTMGKKIFFMTNNSTKTRCEFLVKFNTLGFEATLDEIVSTSFLAALYLKELNFKKKVYVIGTSGVTQELEAVNIKALPIGPDVMPNIASWAHNIVEGMPLDPDVGAVIVGFDHHFSYTKLFKAASYLKHSSCIFIGTNTDESFPAGEGKVVPGTGSIVRAVQTAAGRDPIVMGKPSRIPFDYVQRFHKLDSNRVLMVGDRANTDILFGKNCGLHTLLVLSGVTTLDEVQQWVESGSESTKDCIPEFYLKDVEQFYKLIQNAQ